MENYFQQVRAYAEGCAGVNRRELSSRRPVRPARLSFPAPSGKVGFTRVVNPCEPDVSLAQSPRANKQAVRSRRRDVAAFQSTSTTGACPYCLFMGPAG